MDKVCRYNEYHYWHYILSNNIHLFNSNCDHGRCTILMGSKLTVAANHLSFAMQNEDNESFQIALDQLHRYFLINGILFIITIIFILILVVIASLFAGILIEFINESGFNYSISLLTKAKYI